MTRRGIGLSLNITATLLFGSYGIFVNKIDADPLLFAFSMQIVGLLVFAIVVAVRGLESLTRKDVKYLFLFTLSVTVADVSFFAALKILSVADAVLVKFTFPFMLVFLAPVVLKERFEKKMLLVAAIGLSGLALILFQERTSGVNILGVVFALVAAAGAAGFFLFLKKLGHISQPSILFYRYALSTTIMVPFVLGFTDIPFRDSNTLLLLALFGLVFAVLASWIAFEGIKRISAAEIGILSYLDPLSATILAVLILGQSITLATIAGAAIILGSGAMTILFKPTQ